MNDTEQWRPLVTVFFRLIAVCAMLYGLSLVFVFLISRIVSSGAGFAQGLLYLATHVALLAAGSAFLFFGAERLAKIVTRGTWR